MSPLPVSLILLSIIALVLYILSHYAIPAPPPSNPPSRYFWPGMTLVVTVMVLLLWYILPLRVGG
jgi:hypothetical protein